MFWFGFAAGFFVGAFLYTLAILWLGSWQDERNHRGGDNV
jgi:hypothetical protein